MCGCLSHASDWGPGPQPRHVPWLGIEPATLWFSGLCSIHWPIPDRAKQSMFWIKPFHHGQNRGTESLSVIYEDTNRTSSPESPCSAPTHWQFWLIWPKKIWNSMASTLPITLHSNENGSVCCCAVPGCKHVWVGGGLYADSFVDGWFTQSKNNQILESAPRYCCLGSAHVVGFFVRLCFFQVKLLKLSASIICMWSIICTWSSLTFLTSISAPQRCQCQKCLL